tara:strand:+ start:26822 stop:27178 length:357 start_codon:yes stop_codon:yes gene_type:complete
MTKVYSYNKCSTCRKALKWLKEKGITFQLIDITINPPSKDEIRNAIGEDGVTKFLFNTSGKSYRALGASVVKAMNTEQAICALASDGKLIKRPFIVTDNQDILIGFKEDEWIKVFLNH